MASNQFNEVEYEIISCHRDNEMDPRLENQEGEGLLTGHSLQTTPYLAY